MILYVDETENNEFFILTGLLVESEEAAKKIYYSFKKKAINYKIAEDLRAKLFTEFKSILMDSKFQSLKKKMIEEIVKADTAIVYSIYFKKEKKIKKSFKNKIYIKMLSKIVKGIKTNVEIVFDNNSKDYDENIINTLAKLDNVVQIRSADSQLTPGLQLVDNLCSVIRQKYSNTEDKCYKLIKAKITKIEY